MAVRGVEADPSLDEANAGVVAPHVPEPAFLRLGAGRHKGDTVTVVAELLQPLILGIAIWRVEPHAPVPVDPQSVGGWLDHLPRRRPRSGRPGARVEIERAEGVQDVFRRDPVGAVGGAVGLVKHGYFLLLRYDSQGMINCACFLHAQLHRAEYRHF